jgi:sarcosine oxidase
VAREADVVVVGGGITGVATLRALARSGARTTLIEQFELGHERGSSHGASRIFRLSYTDASYARLAREALTGWRRVEEESGEQLIVHTGTLDLGDAAAATERALADASIAHEAIDGDAARLRWRLALDAAERVVFQPEGGYLLADRAHAALLAGGRAAGGDVVEHEPVVRIDPAQDGVVVRTATGDEIVAAAVVVAAGAWARALLEPLGIALPVVATRETVAYFAHPEAEKLPAVIEYPSAARPLGSTQVYYALPAPGHGLKAGVHHSGPPTDPDETGAPDERVVEATAGWVAQRFPDAQPAPHELDTCIYTNTADESFVIETHGRVVVASACSGHGFKFAPVLGERIAALARAAAHTGP